jgi:hypothetical protein
MTTDAATIAASIDVSTDAGWNLRALLLRLLDRDDSQDVGRSDVAAYRAADALGLVYLTEGGPCLCRLGGEVAERLRPAPWRVEGPFAAADGTAEEEWSVTGVDELPIAICFERGSASRIADLLTKADAEDAKQYKPG